MNDETPKWVDDLLNEALKGRDHHAFEAEFEALRKLAKEREPRAIIMACACLKMASLCLITAAGDEPVLTDRAEDMVLDVLRQLTECEDGRGFSYLPAIMSTLLIQREYG